MIDLVLPLHSNAATLANVGGKAVNLARLAQLDFPVPAGFFITTAAYLQFLEANHLPDWLQSQVQEINPEDPAGLQRVSDAIRHRFRQGTIPEDLAQAISAAYEEMSGVPVAVRSSATAEDLPETSFAGQQDTYLNIVGETAVLDTVRNCWGSLWTARAIAYRARNGIAHEQVSMAVVVQEMVPSAVSGVLFTANPLTGRRTETVIDATWGLGEALVSGQVDPDQYVVETASGRLVSQQVGAKQLAIHGREGGGTETVVPAGSLLPALTGEQISDLTALGANVASHYPTPQDMEWAIVDDRIYLLQTRPITSLFPLPENARPEPVEVYFSFAAVQGVYDPFTPLGQDALAYVFSTVGRERLGYPVTLANQRIMLFAAERIWLNITPMMRNRLGQSLIRRVMHMVEPRGVEQLLTVMDDPRFHHPGRPRLKTMRRIFRLLRPVIANFLGAQRHPETKPGQLVAESEAYLDQLGKTIPATPTLADRIQFLENTLGTFFGMLLINFLPLIATGMSNLTLLNRLARNIPGGTELVLTTTRGLPHNVTTEMDLSLWETAQQIAADPAGQAYFTTTPAHELAASWQAGTLPLTLQQSLTDFLHRYGMRGIGEIDLGHPRWRENPTQIMQMLQSYLQITDPAQAPDVVFTRGAREAEQALQELAQAVRKTPFGRIKAHLVAMAGRRMRLCAGYRESPKFFIVRLMGIVREELRAAGRELQAQGVLDRPEDIFFLHIPELHRLVAGESTGWRELVAERRAAYDRELQRQQLPRLLLSDGTTYYEAAEHLVGDMVGTPVSPGVVEGAVRVIRQPHGAQILPGEILVCPGTDPAWTPLFLAAGGLVTEVGGLMTHGSVVAREYGIPAVVGVAQATTRLATGQRIRLDGSTGRISLLD